MLQNRRVFTDFSATIQATLAPFVFVVAPRLPRERQVLPIGAIEQFQRRCLFIIVVKF
jgi:hypothetical protein